jgi:hypothetical protein
VIPPPPTYRHCPICGLAATENYTGVHHADCIRCGDYIISAEAAALLDGVPFGDRQAANISGYIRENRGMMISASSLPFLRSLRAPSVAERATKLLALLANKNPIIGQEIQLPSFINYSEVLSRAARPQEMNEHAAQELRDLLDPLAITSSQEPAEVDFLIRTYLAAEEQFITTEDLGGSLLVIITSRGWKHLDMKPAGTTNVGFVAMWYAKDMDVLWELAFYPAITAAGYVPSRIDKKEHNNKIDDEIIASIRASKFVVADFTGQRGGVYYEAGFAQGLGKPVIWTIRQDDLKNVHFDTRQFNHIPWESSKLVDFKLALQRRIEANFGRGPNLPK